MASEALFIGEAAGDFLLNIVAIFAEFGRVITGERVRDLGLPWQHPPQHLVLERLLFSLPSPNRPKTWPTTSPDQIGEATTPLTQLQLNEGLP